MKVKMLRLFLPMENVGCFISLYVVNNFVICVVDYGTYGIWKG